MRVRDARDAYLAENGFALAAYEHPRSYGSIFGVRFQMPNPPAHQSAIRLHDLHHVATGYGTDHAGEAELAAWQARRGLASAGLYVKWIVLGNLTVGLLAAPVRTVAALRLRGGRSLFSSPAEYASLLEQSVGELRSMLGIPEQGLTTRPRGLHAHAPGA